MKRIFAGLTSALLLFCLCGCSVFMAMSGKPDADIGMLSIGQDRSIVIANLGQPAQTITTDTGRIDKFELQRGNAPSGGRALGHGALDLLTFGFWEIIGTPIEIIQGETFTLTVEYGKDDKITKVHSSPGKVGEAI